MVRKRPLPLLYCRMSCHSYAISPSAHRKIGKSACPSVRGKNKTPPPPMSLPIRNNHNCQWQKTGRSGYPPCPQARTGIWPGVAPLGTRLTACCRNGYAQAIPSLISSSKNCARRPLRISNCPQEIMSENERIFAIYWKLLFTMCALFFF